MADRGFGYPDLLRCLSVQLGWSYRIRLKKDAWIWRAKKGWIQLKDYHFRRGEAIALQQIYLFKEARYGPVNLVVGRNNINGEFWAVVSDEATTLQTFAEYGLRFEIEESFLDDQSNVWNIQRSEIRSVCALSRLWFVLALATLYLTAQGVTVVDTGQRRCVDTHWFRGNSYLRIGWDWVKIVLNQGGRLIRHVLFTGHHDPQPAKASRKQHRKRSHRLEFTIHTYAYEPV